MTKVFIGVGHGGVDPGAIGKNGMYEKNLNLAIAQSARIELERHGVQVLMSRYKDENDSLQEEIRECNAYRPDIAIDFHNNAAGNSGGSGGDGFECYRSVEGGKSTELAENIEAQVKLIGQNSRGVKTKVNSYGTDWFGFVRETICPAVLCEFAFVDSKDIEIIDTPEEQKAMGIATAKGILETLGVQWQAPVNQQYYIWCGKFSDKARAEKYKKVINELDGKPYCEIRKV